MTPFHFSEETRLFAKHAEVVNEMRKRFETNLRAFFDEVAAALREREQPGNVRYVVGGGSAYFWLSADADSNAEENAAAWCYWNDPEIVRTGGVTFSVTWKNGSSEQRARIAALADAPALAGFVRKEKPGVWRIFDVRVTWKDDQDPVTATVAVLDPLLRLLLAAQS